MAASKKKKKPHPPYPKKLRYKLERIARARDEREGIAPPDDPKPLWYEFLEAGSVEVMHSKLDTEGSDSMLWKLESRHTLTATYNQNRLRRPPPRVVTAPWEALKEKLPRE